MLCDNGFKIFKKAAIVGVRQTVVGLCDLCALAKPISSVAVKLTYPWLTAKDTPVEWNFLLHSHAQDWIVSGSFVKNNGMDGFENNIKEMFYQLLEGTGKQETIKGLPRAVDPLVVDVGANIGAREYP
jgi:hypothetical protein